MICTASANNRYRLLCTCLDSSACAFSDPLVVISYFFLFLLTFSVRREFPRISVLSFIFYFQLFILEHGDKVFCFFFFPPQLYKTKVEMQGTHKCPQNSLSLRLQSISFFYVTLLLRWMYYIELSSQHYAICQVYVELVYILVSRRPPCCCV